MSRRQRYDVVRGGSILTADSHHRTGFVNLAGCDPAAVLERAKALIASSRTPEARKQAKTDCGYYLLRASIEEALQKLKARNESPVGKMAKDEVLAHMPYVREFLRANASDDVQELLDALTDDEISTLYVARLVSIDLILITTPEELREFCERFSDLDARKITAYGTYLVISLWNDKDQVERMTWYVGAAAKQTISQRQKDYLNIFEKLERGEKVSRQRAVFNEKTHDRKWQSYSMRLLQAHASPLALARVPRHPLALYNHSRADWRDRLAKDSLQSIHGQVTAPVYGRRPQLPFRHA